MGNGRPSRTMNRYGSELYVGFRMIIRLHFFLGDAVLEYRSLVIMMQILEFAFRRRRARPRHIMDIGETSSSVRLDLLNFARTLRVQIVLRPTIGYRRVSDKKSHSERGTVSACWRMDNGC
eukprot:scaffold10016_cov54-Attheya_sp.AAC.5